MRLLGRHLVQSGPAVLWAAVTVIVGCGGSSATTEPAQAPKRTARITEVERYLPLESGTVLAYDTMDENTGQRGVVVLQISRPRPDLVELDDGGRIQRLDIGRDGISHLTGGYMLKEPLEVGATFQGKFGQVEITKADVIADLPAGKFVGCLETVEKTPQGNEQVTRVFCPDVGMVALEIQGIVKGEYNRVLFVLRSHGPAIDIENLAEDKE